MVQQCRRILGAGARLQARLLGLHRLYTILRRDTARRDAQRKVPQKYVDAHIALALTSRARRAAVQEILGLVCGTAPLRRQARSLGDTPLTVVTAGLGNSPQRQRWHRAWLDLQADLAAMSSNSHHIPAPDSGHCINHDTPRLLARVVTETIHTLHKADGSSA